MWDRMDRVAYNRTKSAGGYLSNVIQGNGILSASETGHTAALGMITPVSSGEKANPHGTQTLTPMKPRLQHQTACCHICP